MFSVHNERAIEKEESKQITQRQNVHLASPPGSCMSKSVFKATLFHSGGDTEEEEFDDDGMMSLDILKINNSVVVEESNEESQMVGSSMKNKN